ncbi:MAG: DUF192 domain-containing protein [bacterium]
MKRFILAIITFITTSLCCYATTAQAIENPLAQTNNKFGIHILDTSELAKAQELVNSTGGDWGYVTIPIQATDRDKPKWQAFMQESKDKHIIPILRITTIPQGGTWQEGKDTDLVDFANFLNDLEWPVQNRYVIIFNEVNRSTEWGDKVDPAKYARILKNARTIFKERSDNFFIMPAGLDNALPTSSTSMRAQEYLRAMMVEDPAIWSYIDGWNSHSYPNPGFSAPPTQKGWTSITSYKTELAYIKIAQKPVFITETGWTTTKLTEDKRASYLETALNIWASDSNVVAVTPFLLTAGAGDFVPFSFTTNSGETTATYKTLQNFVKIPGKPTVTNNSPKSNTIIVNQDTDNAQLPTFRLNKALLKLENLFRQLLGISTKNYLTIGNSYLTVEVANNSKSWEKGLSGRQQLADGTGMFFIFPYEHIPLFWMKDMTFPIDIIWIKDQQIVDFTLNAPVPTGANKPTYSPRSPVNRVLEVPTGYIESHDLQIGDNVTLITE